MKKKLSGEAKPKTKKVRFNLYAPEAERVFLAGDFNNWDVHNLPMKKDNKETGRPASFYQPEGMNTGSGLMTSGLMTRMPRKELKILLEARIASE